jgi:G:T/U-mismatch repair DNA glycosylase
MNEVGNNENRRETMNETQKKAYQAGVTDKMSGFYKAIAVCKRKAAEGDKNCAAYVKGFEGSGVGE